jgi:hypothetical protein
VPPFDRRSSFRVGTDYGTTEEFPAGEGSETDPGPRRRRTAAPRVPPLVAMDIAKYGPISLPKNASTARTL